MASLHPDQKLACKNCGHVDGVTLECHRTLPTTTRGGKSSKPHAAKNVFFIVSSTFSDESSSDEIPLPEEQQEELRIKLKKEKKKEAKKNKKMKRKIKIYKEKKNRKMRKARLKAKVLANQSVIEKEKKMSLASEETQ